MALVAAWLPATATGHDGIVGVFVEPDHISPGGFIAIRGDNVATDDPVHVDLLTGSARIELASAVTDAQGHFTVGVTLPTDLAQGTYAIEVDGGSGIQMTAFVQVEGAPTYGGDGAPIGQDEGLPALSPGAVQRTAGGSQSNAAPGDPTSDIDPVPFVALFAAIAALAVLVWRTRRPPPARTESADLP